MYGFYQQHCLSAAKMAFFMLLEVKGQDILTYSVGLVSKYLILVCSYT